jgi:hypothetical protein
VRAKLRAAAVEVADDDGVEVHRAVHRGVPVGLEHAQQLALAWRLEHVEHGTARVAQDAEAPIAVEAHARGLVCRQRPGGQRPQRHGRTLEAHISVALEDELAIAEPLEELGDLARALVVGQRGVPERARLVRAHAAHRLEIGDRRAHVVQRALDARFEIGVLSGGERPDADVHDRLGGAGCGPLRDAQPEQLAVRRALDLQDGVHQQPQLAARALEDATYRIDQKRHVVVDDVDDGLGGMSDAGRAGRLIHAHLGRARRPLADELEQRQAPLEQRLGPLGHEIAGRHVGEQGSEEGDGEIGGLGAELLPGHVLELVDQVDLQHVDA